MIHLPPLIEDLGLILIAAAVVTLLFKKLKQPVVLGYLIAGFIVGPNFTLFPTIKDSSNISIWAEIGVIFMLFGLGLEFSLKKLAQVGKSASITALFEIISMLGVGYLVGQLLGWSKMDSIFLGGILSISSTTIIVRAFDELGFKGKNFVSLVFGALIVEDLIAILLLVLLSSVAVTKTMSGVDLALSSIRLGFFLVLWFLLGIYLLPIFLKSFLKYFSDETMLIVSIGLCLMMVIIATHTGFSPALGAFVMGSILSETPTGRRIEHLIAPVKSLFSAIFFVSVGMLISLGVIAEYLWIILLITFITILGKFISTTLGAIISGRSIRDSVQSGMSLAQIGEFSFIIATLGMSLKVTSEFLYPIAVTVSAITTFTTPYLIKVSDQCSTWVEQRLPGEIRQSLAKYEAAMSANSGKNVFTLLWKEYGLKIILNSVVVLAITLVGSRVALPYLSEKLSLHYLHLILCSLTLLISTPFLWNIFLGRPSFAEEYQSSEMDQIRKLQLGISIVKFLIGCVLTGFVVSNFTSTLAYSGILLIAVTAIGALFFSRYSESIYRSIETRFISNLTENERIELEKKARIPQLAPWNANLVEFTLSPNSSLVAKSLRESLLKENFGITIAMIERGELRILAPKKDDLLLPGDRLFIIGTEDQLTSVREIIEKKLTHPSFLNEVTFGLESITLTLEDRFINKSIRECGLRETVNGLIVGIEREGERFLNPDSSIILLANDLVWLVGDVSRIKALRSSH